MRARRLSAIVGLVASVLAAGCGGDSSGPPAVKFVAVSSLASQVEVGATVQFTATAKDGKGNTLSGRTVTWSSSAPTVASVDGAGVVTGVTPGAATITATSEGASGTGAITVLQVPVASVVIDNRTPAVRQGGTAQLNALTLDAIGRTLSGRAITWSSALPATASVTQQGLVTGVLAGTTYIRATSEGKTDSVRFLVRSLNAPTIAGVAPASWTPGAAATINGTNFAPDLVNNVVRVNGVQATVTAATATAISFIVPPATALPCTPTGPVPISVSVAGDSIAAQAVLSMATQRTLAVGESMLLTGAAEVGCNEFPATSGTYVVTAFNYGTTSTASASFQLVGAALAASSSALLKPATTYALGAQATPTAGPLATVAAASRDQRLAIGHAAALQSSIDFMRAHPNQRAALQAKRARDRAAYARAGVNYSTVVNEPPAVGTKFWKRMMKTFGNYSTYDSVRVRVVYVGPKLIIMEDSLSPLAGTMDSEFQAIGTEFDRDMFGYLSNFGDPLVLDPEYDNNGRVIAVFSKKVNDYTIGSGGSLLGFVTSCDFSPQSYPPNQSFACPPSNEGEYFYAFVPNPSATGNGNWSLADWRHYVRGTLLHEFKHVVMFAERIYRDAQSGEAGWLEEATAQQATELWARKLYGNKGQRADIQWSDGIICDYVRPPDTRFGCTDPVEAIGHHMGFLYRHYASNESKSIINSSDNVIYGSSWLFARWVTDTYGGPDEGVFLRSLVQQQNDVGITNLQNRTGKSWAEMMGYFSLAAASDNYPGGTISDPRARITSWNTRDIFSNMSASLRYSDGSAAFPRAWPINVRATSFGTFPSTTANVFSLPGGGFAVWELSGAQTLPQALGIRNLTGGAPPANVGMGIVRVK